MLKNTCDNFLRYLFHVDNMPGQSFQIFRNKQATFTAVLGKYSCKAESIWLHRCWSRQARGPHNFIANYNL